MNVHDIIKQYLIENGCDGLSNPDLPDGCGCPLDDLNPCNCLCLTECVPGRLAEPDAEQKADGYERVFVPADLSQSAIAPQIDRFIERMQRQKSKYTECAYHADEIRYRWRDLIDALVFTHSNAKAIDELTEES